MKIPAFSLAISPSKYLAGYIITLHCLALLALLYLPFSPLESVVLSLLNCAHLVYCLWRHCYSGNPCWIDSIEYSHQLWLLHRGVNSEPVVLRSATVWRAMVVLNFQGDSGQCYPLVLLSDSTGKHLLRRLRVLLRHRPVYGGAIP